MKKFILNTFLVVIASLVLFWLMLEFSSFVVKRRGFENHQTESNLLMMKPGKHYDLGLVGISHARNFSRHGNHQRMEKILNRSVLNLGQGLGACGMSEQLFYLKYAYSVGIEFDTVVIIVSGPVFYGNFLNRASNTFNYEPFNLNFFIQYLQYPAENKKERLLSYLRSKFGPIWIQHKPFAWSSNDNKLEKLDSVAVKTGINLAYQSGLNPDEFERNAQRIEKAVQIAISHNSKVIFVCIPALFGKWPGHENIVAFQHKMDSIYQTPFYDFSDSIKDPSLYYDHHHFNTDGVVFFLEKMLKPALENK